MDNGRLAVNRVRFQKAGAELINIIKSLKENLREKTKPLLATLSLLAKNPYYPTTIGQ